MFIRIVFNIDSFVIFFSATYALGVEEARRQQSRSSLLLICSGISPPPFFKNHLQFGARSAGTHRSSVRRADDPAPQPGAAQSSGTDERMGGIGRGSSSG